MSSAMPHLLQRLRRAISLHYLRSRQAQLRDSIDVIEKGIAADQLALDTLRTQLRVVDVQLDSACLGDQRQRIARIGAGWYRP